MTAPAIPLLDLLPGTWAVMASTFPMWTRGDRLSPAFTYSVRSTDPLVLDDTVSWFTPTGVEKRLRGTDTPHGDGLRWRGRGLLRLVHSDWSVAGASPGEDVLAIRFSKTPFTPAGVDVLLAEGSMIEDIRHDLAADPAWLGLDSAEVAALRWLRDGAAG